MFRSSDNTSSSAGFTLGLLCVSPVGSLGTSEFPVSSSSDVSDLLSVTSRFGSLYLSGFELIY